MDAAGNQRRWQTVEGSPNPLGLSYCAEECAYNFALYSKHATDVRLLLFTADEFVAPLRVVTLDPRINRSGRVWHCRVPAEVVEEFRRAGGGARDLRRVDA